MQKGTIVKLFRDKGFGFIKIEGENKELFFHANDIENHEFDNLKEGEALEFEVIEGRKGPQASNIRRIAA